VTSVKFAGFRLQQE